MILVYRSSSQVSSSVIALLSFGSAKRGMMKATGREGTCRIFIVGEGLGGRVE